MIALTGRGCAWLTSEEIPKSTIAKAKVNAEADQDLQTSQDNNNNKNTLTNQIFELDI